MQGRTMAPRQWLVLATAAALAAAPAISTFAACDPPVSLTPANGPVNDGTAVVISDTDAGQFAGQVISPAGQYLITKLTWAGAYTSAGPGSDDCATVPSDAFSIRIHQFDEDTPTVPPLVNLTQGTGFTLTRNPSLIPIAQGDMLLSLNEYGYTASFNPALVLPGGTDYYVEIANNVAGACSWAWEKSSAAVAFHWSFTHQGDVSQGESNFAQDLSLTIECGCSSAAECPAPGNTCLQAACNAGICGTTPNNGVPCNDGNVCTMNDVCQGGNCTAGTPVAGCCNIDDQCDDGSGCTADTCNTGSHTCQFTPTPGTGCNDGSACTTGDVCNASGQCAGTPLPDCCKNDNDCNDGDPCTIDTCNVAESSCSHAPASFVACNDGNMCTTGDICVSGVCTGGPPLDCDDEDDCTTDACDPEDGCAHAVSPGAACNDNNACTTGDTCSSEGECSGAEVGGCCNVNGDCNDGNPCTADTCNLDTHTCEAAPDDSLSCSDEDPCTDDSCRGGTCVGLEVPDCCMSDADCDDGAPCTTDSCSPESRCLNVSIQGCCESDADCEDGNTCNGIDACQNPGAPTSACLPGAFLDCNGNGQADNCDLAQELSSDCNANSTPDGCDLEAGADDCNANGVPDECEADCNNNGVADACDIGDGSDDCNGNGIPDECERDCNANGVPDGCDLEGGDSVDQDEDNVIDECDNCPGEFNILVPYVSGASQDNCALTLLLVGAVGELWQIDFDCDGVGNACDVCAGDDTTDSDEDGVPDACDVCAGGDDTLDGDGDGFPDGCDFCLGQATSINLDSDGDSWGNECDNCPFNANPFQTDTDDDGAGDVCDLCPLGSDQADRDDDGLPNACDNCPDRPNAAQADSDGDGVGDACDTDGDQDGVADTEDQCPGTPLNAVVDAEGCTNDQVDRDSDGICDPDAPSGGPANCSGSDNCPDLPNPDQEDVDGNGIGDLCDGDVTVGNVAVDMAASATTVLPGQTVEVSLLGSNLAGAEATGVVLELSYSRALEVAQSFGILSKSDSTGLVWLGFDLAGAGAESSSAVRRVILRVPASTTPGAILLTARVRSDSLDLDDRDNEAMIQLTVQQSTGGNDNGSGQPFVDSDEDGIADSADNCPGVANFDQLDQDEDGVGDACDLTPGACESDESCGEGQLCIAGVCTPVGACGDCGDGAMTMGMVTLLGLAFARFRPGRRKVHHE